MQAVQTFWSKPLINSTSLGNSYYAGWYSELTFYMGTAYSFLTISKFYPELLLITDTFGKNLIVNTLGLDYYDVVCCLDNELFYDLDLVALPKLFSYNYIKIPFLHFDNDIFIWSHLGDRIHNAELVVQNYEHLAKGPYIEAISIIKKNFINIPRFISQIALHGITKSVNAGVIGGNNNSFFESFSKEAFNFVKANISNLDLIDKRVFNTVFEQHMFCEMALDQSCEIHTILDSDDVSLTWNMNLVPILNKFVHLLGEGKKNPRLCEQVLFRMKYEYPEHYEDILRYYTSKRCISEKDNNLLRMGYFERKYEISKTIFAFLDSHSADQLFKTKFKVRKEVVFEKRTINGNHTDVAVNSEQRGDQLIIELHKWDKLLIYFKDATSGEELHTYLLNQEWITVGLKNNLRYYLLNMITSNLLYTNILEFE